MTAGEAVGVSVLFDPTYCSDYQSRVEEQSITVRFREHNYKVCTLHAVQGVESDRFTADLCMYIRTYVFGLCMHVFAHTMCT